MSYSFNPYRILLVTLFSLFLLSGCEKKENKPLSTKPFEGQTITLIVPQLNARLIRGPIQDEVPLFEAETGAKVRVLTPSWDETIHKIDTSIKEGNKDFDIYVVIAMWNGTLLGNNLIEPIPDNIKQQINWDDVLPIYRDTVLSWGGVAYGLPYDGDCINLYYRKDIFENPQYQARFEKTYGYPLSPPKTWKEFADIAQFFNGWDWDNDGKKEYGFAGLRVQGDISMLQFFATAAAYAKHPDDKAYYFDPETMKPRINNPGFLRALKEYIALTQFGPPGMASFAGHDVRDNFVSGEVAMALDWADMGVHAVDSPVSIVRDKVGYAQIPGSNEVYNSHTHTWDKRLNMVSSISGNWMFLVNKNSQHKDLAFAFAAHMTSAELTKKLTATSGIAVNPSRYSHFKDPEMWNKSGFSTQSAKAYLDTITTSLANPNVEYDITIAGAGRYYQVADTYIYKALTHQMSPQIALDTIAQEWDKITDEMGRENQIASYKAALNLR
ncbi:MAG: extracellular solute-binding protein [Sulfurospirillaceae bacterium]|nr:extracellular solute-binding protein [Sulfurospirillaceae bacterium]